MAREYGPPAEGFPDWERLTDLNTRLYQRGTILPSNQNLPKGIRWAKRLVEDRRISWNQDGARYIYDGTRMKFGMLNRLAGRVACITEVRTEIAAHRATVTNANYRTIRYRVGGVETGAVLEDHRDVLEVPISSLDNPDALSEQVRVSREQMRISKATRADLGLTVPGPESLTQLATWLEAGEVLTRPPEQSRG